MNLWIFQHYATPPDTFSGTRHYNFAKYLSEQAYDVTIFASGFNHSTFREERLTEKEVYKIELVQGVRFVWIKTPPYFGNGFRRVSNMITYAFRSYLYASILNQKPDIIFASNPHLFSGITGYLLKLKYNAHFVFEVRDLWPQVFIDIGAFSKNNPFILALKLLEQFIYKKAEKIILLMPKAFDYIKSKGTNPNKIIYIPHALDVDSFEKSLTNIPKELDVINQLKRDGKTIIGYLGAHGVADSLDTLIECCEILQQKKDNDLHFVMIGHGSEKNRLIEKATSLGLNNISFFQAIPKNQVPSAIKLFDIAIVSKKDSPLYKYGTSFIKTFDYMACGVPILWAVNSPDCPVLDAGCGLAIPPEQADKMAEAILLFSKMTIEERNEMGKRGFHYVKANHDCAIIGSKIKYLLQQL